MRLLVNDRSMDGFFGRWINEGIDPVWEDGDPCVGVLRNGQPVAGIVLTGYNGSNLVIHMRLADPYAMSQKFLKELFRMAFVEMKARRLTAPCDSTNGAILSVTQRMGFECEAILKDFTATGDLMLMVMRPDACKYLENSHG